jgi:3-polyprenyl-4-hydroxybenzoate decarboxylase
MDAGHLETRRLVVGISGATGIAYGTRVLELARKAGVETHLVVSPRGQQTRTYETPLSAHVALKERRRLVLLSRETPLSMGHLRPMTPPWRLRAPMWTERQA